MQAAPRALFLAALVVVAAVGASSAATCKGTTPISSLPYSVEYTTTGDAQSTSFVFTVCSSSCSPSSAACQPLTSFSVGADQPGVTTTPASTAGGCGVDFTGADLGTLASSSPATSATCDAFYLTTPKAEATLADICGAADCAYRLELQGGDSAVGYAAGEGPQPTPSPSGGGGGGSPSPTPYGRRLHSAAAQQEQEVVEGSGSLRALLATPYGRRLNEQGHGRRLSAHMAGRRRAA